MQDKIFLPVAKLRFQDLYDWSCSKERFRSTHVSLLEPRDGRNKDSDRYRRSSTIQQRPHGELTKSNERNIALFRFKQEVFAIREACPHAGGPLHLGEIEELGNSSLCVRCPWHGWKIDLRTGHIAFPSGRSNVTVVYPVKVAEDGTIYIGFDGMDETYFSVDCNAF